MHYARPPITEAVLELRLKQDLGRDTVEAISRRRKSEYPVVEPQEVVSIVVDGASRTASAKGQTWLGQKLSSGDRANALLMQEKSFACIRLAPYVGWETFRDRAAADWAEFRRVAGPAEVSRIGIRYINRLDVPLPSAPTPPAIDVRHYLNLWPNSPNLGPNIQPMTGYTIQVSRALGVDGCHINLASTSVPSPLVAHASFLLDLDVYRETDLPRRDDALWAIIEKMRHHKNAIFEACITDRARKLFE